MVTGIMLLIYFLFGRIAPWSLAVTMTLLLGRHQKVGWGLLCVGLMGVLEDIAGVRVLGLSSVFLVCLLGLVWLIERQYRGQWMWWYIIGGGGEFVFRWVTGRPVTLESLLWQVVALWLVQWLFKRVGQSEGIYVGR